MHEIDFLGHKINALGIGPNEAKVTAVKTLTEPADLPIRSLLGMRSY